MIQLPFDIYIFFPFLLSCQTSRISINTDLYSQIQVPTSMIRHDELRIAEIGSHFPTIFPIRIPNSGSKILNSIKTHVQAN